MHAHASVCAFVFVHLCVSVCACVSACVRACMCVCVCVLERGKKESNYLNPRDCPVRAFSKWGVGDIKTNMSTGLSTRSVTIPIVFLILL